MAGKNHHLHITFDKKSKANIREKAKKLDIPMAEYCRRRIGGNSQLDRIERKIDKLLNEKF